MSNAVVAWNAFQVGFVLGMGTGLIICIITYLICLRNER